VGERWFTCIKWYQSLFLVYIFQAREAIDKEHSDTHQVVSEQNFVCILQAEERKEDRVLETLWRLFADRQQS
jgi:hypothetical protein